jgi:pilus assembly protein CpaB
MRLRTLALFAIALVLAGGTALLVRARLVQRSAVVAAAPAPRPAPQKSILVARVAIARGHILQPTDLAARPWPQAGIIGDYILAGGGPEKALLGSVAREPFVAGEPIIRTKIVKPGEHGFLAAVLHPGMRAVSVPVDATADVSGFVLPGDRVDLLMTLPVPQDGPNPNGSQHKAAETVLRNLRVIAVDQQPDSKGLPVVARTVTFEVTPKQSEIVAVAGDIGKLSLSLRSLAITASTSPVDPGIDPPAPAPVDPAIDPPAGSFTLDSQILPRVSSRNHDDSTVTILRGNGNNGTSVSSQFGSRGS